ncbi:hypothetical protein SAMN05444678_10693 [Sphingomonas sp. YR710]|jgi:hypothetical protein|uniref:hypothetical protein n=1 Tax=Sphingomonas sp. YR710 TaxID=1882773 RepID=UPI000884B04C|nr:hypothetical protein [Sphingomonas sp. YR710]SDC84613.1 hypothetical protein SAMN05444678_10693 [Sphingomonas sp. YR710]
MADIETPAQAAEAAAVRRRWINLGEILAVVAVLISALTLWNSYSDRRDSRADKAQEDAHAKVKARTLVLKATPEKDGDRLAITAHGDQAIEGQTIRFPTALGLDPVDTTSPRIEQSWFASGLKSARKAAGETAEGRGDQRLPVAVTTRYYVDGAMTEDTALYDIGYATEGHFLMGTSVRLRGLSLIEHVSAKAAPARVDAIWKARHPKKPDA